jgi:hypothetical protein
MIMSISQIHPQTGGIYIHYATSFRGSVQLTEEVQPTFGISKPPFSDAIFITSIIL